MAFILGGTEVQGNIATAYDPLHFWRLHQIKFPYTDIDRHTRCKHVQEHVNNLII